MFVLPSPDISALNEHFHTFFTYSFSLSLHSYSPYTPFLSLALDVFLPHRLKDLKDALAPSTIPPELVFMKRIFTNPIQSSCKIENSSNTCALIMFCMNVNKIANSFDFCECLCSVLYRLYPIFVFQASHLITKSETTSHSHTCTI